MSEELWQKYYGQPNPIYGNKKQFGMLIDLNKCLGCHTCTMACKMTWTDEPGQENMYWNSVTTKPYGGYPKKNGADHPAKYDYERPNLYQDTPKGKYPNVWQFYLPQPCNHCAQPACLPACPTKAIYKDENGVVKIDQNRCEGYQYCIKACPYDKIYFNPVQKKSQKCIMCFPLVEQGEEPQCVKSCVGKIRVFGDLMDPDSVISKLIRDPSYGTKPYRPELNFGGQHRVISDGERRQLRPDAGTIPSVWYVPPKNVPDEEIEKYFGFALQGVTAEPYEPEGSTKIDQDESWG